MMSLLMNHSHRNIRLAKYNNAHLRSLPSSRINHLTLPKPQLYTATIHHLSTTNRLGYRHSTILMPSRRDRSGYRNPDIVVSKTLSFTLRHGAVKEGLSIRPDGYVSVADLLEMPKYRRLGLDFEYLQRLVRDNDKQRYQLAYIDSDGNPIPMLLRERTKPTSSLSETTIDTYGHHPEATTPTTLITSTNTSIVTIKDPLNEALLPNPSSYLIRASQGHSIPITSTNLQLIPITTENLPQYCIHGTFYPFLDPILASGGLKPMRRNHIHFSPGLLAGLKPGATTSKVISGMRRDAQLLLYINLPKAIAAGITFWRSENGVILSEGDPHKNGLLGMEYVDKIEDIGSAQLGIIWEQGKGLLKELPQNLRNQGAPRGKEAVMKGLKH